MGCRIVMWRVNTQQHRTIGDIPYSLMFGQLPRVGIAQLPLAQELIDRLATETALNDVFDVEGFDIGNEGPTTAGTTAAGGFDIGDDGPTTAGTTTTESTAGTTAAAAAGKPQQQVLPQQQQQVGTSLM